ncbi:hypothetical protein [Clostridium sp. C8-1-8]|nr:hypothetical protein [Clostridium sp. C8-1-8]
MKKKLSSLIISTLLIGFITLPNISNLANIKSGNLNGIFIEYPFPTDL